jgi:hypothetical protein
MNEKINEKAGPFLLASLSERSIARNGRSALFVAGSVGMYSDNIMETPSYANNDFLAGVLNYLTDAAAVAIPPKTIAPPMIAVSQGVVAATGTVFLFVLPPAILAGGALFCAARRRR